MALPAINLRTANTTVELRAGQAIAIAGMVFGREARRAHLDDPEWVAGRRAVLRSFLEREAIYLTAPMRQREARARANLTEELATLG